MEDIAQAILKRPGVILLVVLGFVGPTLVFTLLQPNVYEASTRVGIELDWGDRWETGIPGVQLLPPTVTVPRKHTLEVTRAIDSPAIAKEVIKRLGLSGMEPSELSENLAVKLAAEAPHLVRLSYRDTNPQRAQRIASTVAQVASERIRKETPYVYILDVQSWGKAKLPSTPVPCTRVRIPAKVPP
jgi:capsular polysaccharide biosynthesis protein